MKEINDMICELLEQDIASGDKIKFTSTAVEMIHEIAEKCDQIQIVDAPTRIHMIMSAEMLIPIIDKKLREERL